MEVDMVGAYGLGDNLAEDQDEYGGDYRYQTEPVAAEDQCRLSTHAGGAYGVGDGVEAQYGRNGAGVVGLVFLEQGGALVAFILAHCDIAEGCGHQHAFQH